MKALASGAAAEELRTGALQHMSPANRQFVQAKRRRRESEALSIGPMPRCIKCALHQNDPWRNKLRWMMAQTIVAAATAARISPDPLLRHAEAVMAARGDGKSRIKEFRSAAQRARRGHHNKVPCTKRSAASGGLWCPLNGDVKRCAAELGRALPPVQDPSPHDLWTAAKA